MSYQEDLIVITEIDPILGYKLEELILYVQTELDSCSIPPQDPPLTPEEEQTLIDAYHISYGIMIEALTSSILNAYDVIDDEKAYVKSTVNFMTSLNSYVTFESMIPLPQQFEPIPPPSFADIRRSLYSTANHSIREEILNAPSDWFWIGCDPNAESIPTIYDNLVEGLSTVGSGKREKIDREYDRFNAKLLKIGIEFMFLYKERIEVNITTEERANKVYLDFGLKDWIESHGLDLPIYTYETEIEP